MTTKRKNLSKTEGSRIPSAKGMRIVIVYAEWNHAITDALRKGAYNTLVKNGTDKKDILQYAVPGSFELTLGAQFFAKRKKIDAVICLGCVVQGETRHFDFICDAVANGVTEVSLKYNKPVIFGVLTPDNMQQAKERAGGRHGNKGDEAAITAIKMVHLKRVAS
ncbi:MAG TPA: 6,7-dimethyl-8-ribityllumazine synthase [Bacteroidia bacterium]|jgi:6,7-dimethyl-8-ribityllumazine synthase|nr:6,7-dimethyl-8-ribityllumazine synthase [Bacteroidia bacterium]